MPTPTSTPLSTPLTHDGPVRWGILGAGVIAGAAGADLRDTPDNTVHAVGARDLGRARALAETLGAPTAYGSYAELVADPDVDVVYVATTHGQHHEHALLAVEAGKPVLVEKAFTLTERQAREVVEAARARGVFCMEAMWTRLHPLVRRAQEIVAAGTIGEVVSVTADHGWAFDYDPAHRLFDLAAGGSALLDLGVYAAIFPWLFLGAPDDVVATGRRSPTGSDSTVAMLWSYADGRYANVSCTVEAFSPCEATVVGTGGWLTFRRPLFRPTSLLVHVGSPRDGVEEELTAPVEGNGYRPQFAEVARCLRAGLAESPLVPHADTVAIMGLMDRARLAVGARFPADG
ncbi:Gfo/Idh/MocA family oxidoreductase [Actinokineospora sp. PR83]|uniref:Gfo/Idh/MocA family protein n=1 Tax=Actinokineospora sp. PR83 TaxID=2884908 RepID=UPI0027E001A1|nr:Gfo/Idh/MocA family oxidoreductase [Actinokineospora sp. PR83]MCG8918704.1 Gfo/Idh/MocA family oxidoreductase [Actinokineospora sp. PR83]